MYCPVGRSSLAEIIEVGVGVRVRVMDGRMEAVSLSVADIPTGGLQQYGLGS